MFDEDTAVEDQLQTGEMPSGEPFADITPDETEDAPGTSDGQPQAEAQTEEEQPYQLPDEQSKVFPDTVLQEFAEKRYPLLANMLADQNLPEPNRDMIRQVLHDKLNSDIYIQKLRESEQEEEQPEEEPEAVAEENQTPIPAAQLEQEITSFVDRVTDEPTAQKFFVSLNDAAAKASGPNGDKGVAFVKVLSAGAVNLLRDAIPALMGGKDGVLESYIGEYLKTNYEGLDVSHAENSRSSAWAELKGSDPAYANLPDYGTPEWTAAHVKAAEMVPGIEKAVFTDGKGNILPPRQQFAAKAQLAAKLISGTASAQTVAKATQAVETGKKLAKASDQRKALGNLGAGQTRGRITQGQGAGIDQARRDAIARLRNDENPFAGLNPQK